MRRRRSKLATGTAVVVALTVIAVTAAAENPSGSWTVDGDRSEITFVSEAPLERFTGSSDQLEGTVDFDVDDPAAATGAFQFPVGSVKTGNSTRDRHLAGERWLHAEEHPHVRFTIEHFDDVEVAKSEDRLDYRGTARGTVELRGVEQTEEADVQIAVLPDRQLARVQFELEFALADYNVEGSRDRAIGANVGETIEVEGTIYADGS